MTMREFDRMVATLKADLEELENKLARLQADRERLDWLDANVATITPPGSLGEPFSACWGVKVRGKVNNIRADLRSAIDAAMQDGRTPGLKP